MAGNGGHGISATTAAGKAPVTVFVHRTTVSLNAMSGIRANGAAASGAGSARVRIGSSVVTQNVTGVSTAGAGVLRTYTNNEINENLTDGTPIANQDGLN